MMNENVVQQFAALLVSISSIAAKIFTLQEQLRTNPPRDPEALLALVGEIDDLTKQSMDLYARVRDLTKSKKMTAPDLALVYASNEIANLRNQAPAGPDPVRKDSIPDAPNTTPPDVPPAPPETPTVYESFRWYPNPIPSDVDLRATFTRGLKWRSQDGKMWAVTGIGQPVMEPDPQGNPAVEVGPIK